MRWLPLLALCLGTALALGAEAPVEIDLSHAVIVAEPGLEKAVQMLSEEVARRTGIRWEIAATPTADQLYIALAGDAPEGTPEGYAIKADTRGVTITAMDKRGVFFGVGRLLRELRMSRGKAVLPGPLDITSAPAVKLRGHQLGYRPKTNSYDAWTPEMWEQYIRDLVVFGTNAIELVPPRTDDAADSPHFPLPQIEMMKRMSQICDDYDLDVWIWYPALDKDYEDPATVEFALKEWDGVLSQLPRVDALFVPGGDPGHTPPLTMMALLEKQTENLHKSHPKAQMWMSPQGFNKEWMDQFLDYMKAEQPAWLTGVVFGPQNRLKYENIRRTLPEQYLIRHYPDITHTVQCQFPVPEWDYALAITEQREPINPRPKQYRWIFHYLHGAHLQKYSEDDLKVLRKMSFDVDSMLRARDRGIGFITYSEGCNDDINKIIWSEFGWEPSATPSSILREYARYFIGPEYENSFTQGILALEQNWTGPLLTNHNVMTTLAQFQEMEREASPGVKANWRFQQALYRAYYDAYIYRRLQYETQLEQEAMDALRQAGTLGSLNAIARAEATLNRAVTEPVAQDLRARVFELAEALYQSIRMQLSVPRYQAIDVGRGANLDLIDLPLNDRNWLTSQLAEARAADTEAQRLRRVDSVVNWTDPGPGGFYDDLGDPARQPHLVWNRISLSPPAGGEGRGEGGLRGYTDPEFKASVIMGRQYNPNFKASWNRYAETRYETPLVMQYNNLDPEAQYTVRVIYAGDSFDRKMWLAADRTVLHELMPKPFPPVPLEFDLPREATSDGEVTLSFTGEPGRGGNGRGCQVAEVWLIRHPGD